MVLHAGCTDIQAPYRLATAILAMRLLLCCVALLLGLVVAVDATYDAHTREEALRLYYDGYKPEEIACELQPMKLMCAKTIRALRSAHPFAQRSCW